MLQNTPKCLIDDLYHFIFGDLKFEWFLHIFILPALYYKISIDISNYIILARYIIVERCVYMCIIMMYMLFSF